MMPMIDSVTSNCRTQGVMATAGKKGNEKRRNPYVPIFSRTPARMTEPAVGASTWASGSQVWNGNIGTLIANPRKKAKNSQSAAGPAIFGAVVYSSVIEKVYTPVSVWWWKYRKMMPSSINTEPNNVYRKNFIAA